MALQIEVSFDNRLLHYDVAIPEESVYRLCLKPGQNGNGNKYVPEKIIIRRKGKIWVSDVEDHRELVDTLIREINNINFSQ
jgi:hypothetical protein